MDKTMKETKSTVLLVSALLMLLCQLQMANMATAGSNAIATVLSQPPAADIGKKTQCAYCKMHLTVKADTPAASYNGKNYYFCDGTERDAFVKDPKKYLSTTPATHTASPPMSPM
jgi:YHS domain-containing protein